MGWRTWLKGTERASLRITYFVLRISYCSLPDGCRYCRGILGMFLRKMFLRNTHYVVRNHNTYEESPSPCALMLKANWGMRTCLVDGSDVETQWSTCMNGAQTSPVAGAEPREVMPLVSYRASVEAVLHEIHEVAGRRQSAKQVLNP